MRGDDIVALPSGRLATVHSAVRTGQMKKNEGRYVFPKTGMVAVETATAASSSALAVEIEKHDSEITASDMKLSLCPSCKKKTLKIENGCHSCLNSDCSFSKCEI